jgi:oligopeptide transport system permease protein
VTPVLRFLSRRVLQAFVTLLGALFVFQAALLVVPGDPVRALFGPKRPDPSVLAQLQAEFHLDEPFLVQYWYRVTGLLTGDLGHTFPGKAANSVEVGPPVADVVAAAAPDSLRLLVGALLVQGLLGLGLGIAATLARRRATVAVVYLSALGLVSVPVLVLAYVAQTLVGWELGWLPPTGLMEGPEGYVLPMLTLALPATASLVLLTRSELGETMRQRYIRAAEARSLPEHRVIGLHALRASAVPLVTYVAANLGTLLSGLLVVEVVYGVPGLGGLMFGAIQSLDHALLLALLTLATVAVIVANLVADLTYAALDPRIRVGAR